MHIIHYTAINYQLLIKWWVVYKKNSTFQSSICLIDSKLMGSFSGRMGGAETPPLPASITAIPYNHFIFVKVPLLKNILLTILISFLANKKKSKSFLLPVFEYTITIVNYIPSHTNSNSYIYWKLFFSCFYCLFQNQSDSNIYIKKSYKL